MHKTQLRQKSPRPSRKKRQSIYNPKMHQDVPRSKYQILNRQASVEEAERKNSSSNIEESTNITLDITEKSLLDSKSNLSVSKNNLDVPTSYTDLDKTESSSNLMRSSYLSVMSVEVPENIMNSYKEQTETPTFKKRFETHKKDMTNSAITDLGHNLQLFYNGKFPNKFLVDVLRFQMTCLNVSLKDCDQIFDYV